MHFITLMDHFRPPATVFIHSRSFIMSKLIQPFNEINTPFSKFTYFYTSKKKNEEINCQCKDVLIFTFFLIFWLIEND